MKKATLVLVIALLAGLVGCGQKQSISDDIIVVDITKAPASKKELILQDFMDVEYVALETKDDFYNQGLVMDIGKKFMLVRNRNDDGNIYLYDRNGKVLRKINRKGQGGEEYISISVARLDEDNNEMFVNDHYRGRILVYDLFGNFRRSLKIKEGYGSFIDTYNYDIDNLICYDQNNEKIAFVLISKKDGSITKKIKIPFEEKKFLEQTQIDEANNLFMVSPGPYRTIILHKGNWILLELSSDTIYSLLPDYSLRPFLVRIPSIQSMHPEVHLILRLLSDRYYFIETIKNVYNFDTNSGFPKTFMAYDTQEKELFNYAVYNGDYSIKKEIYMVGARPVNHEIESWYPLESPQLVESYNNGELKGKLKKIAATLNEDSNPVIMLIKHKK
ncbi:MAG: 6-bladed beta-propeller [Macellibacteroides fermentans]|uniref:6-bladed beta-propeller n=1 Tax=Macellibacteroides fermentans TaxID=879969 RepID=UPI003AC6F9CA